MTKASAALVARLKANPNVLGLIEYGSARYQQERILGDYDLIVVLRERPAGVESLHFRFDGLIVDLNITSPADIDAMPRAEGFDRILLDGRIIHDPSGEVGRAVRSLRERHDRSPEPALPPGRAAAMRHGVTHTFDKLKRSAGASETIDRYLLHQCVYWLLPQYFEIRRLPYRGEHAAFEHLRAHEPELLGAFERFYAATELGEQTESARLIAEAVLAPVGGLWDGDELLVFGDHEQGERLFDQLIGRGDAAG